MGKILEKSGNFVGLEKWEPWILTKTKTGKSLQKIRRMKEHAESPSDFCCILERGERAGCLGLFIACNCYPFNFNMRL